MVRPDHAEEAHRLAIARPLDAFNEAATRDDAPERCLALLVEAPDGDTVGGLWGRAYFQWMFVELLFVPTSLRGRGVGTDLVLRAESAALAWGCHGVWLDSFTFQAPAFYQRLGYTVFGSIEDYPDGHTRHYLKKRLTPRSA